MIQSKILGPLWSLCHLKGEVAAASAYGNIYTFGGEEPGGTFDNNEKYDPNTNKWTEDMPIFKDLIKDGLVPSIRILLGFYFSD